MAAAASAFAARRLHSPTAASAACSCYHRCIKLRARDDVVAGAGKGQRKGRFRAGSGASGLRPAGRRTLRATMRTHRQTWPIMAERQPRLRPLRQRTSDNSRVDERQPLATTAPAVGRRHWRAVQVGAIKRRPQRNIGRTLGRAAAVESILVHVTHMTATATRPGRQI